MSCCPGQNMTTQDGGHSWGGNDAQHHIVKMFHDSSRRIQALALEAVCMAGGQVWDRLMHGRGGLVGVAAVYDEYYHVVGVVTTLATTSIFLLRRVQGEKIHMLASLFY